MYCKAQRTAMTEHCPPFDAKLETKVSNLSVLNTGKIRLNKVELILNSQFPSAYAASAFSLRVLRALAFSERKFANKAQHA